MLVKLALSLDLLLFGFELVMSFDMPDQLPSIQMPMTARLIPAVMLIANLAAAISVFV